jgi:hypothetical protein
MVCLNLYDIISRLRYVRRSSKRYQKKGSFCGDVAQALLVDLEKRRKRANAAKQIGGARPFSTVQYSSLGPNFQSERTAARHKYFVHSMTIDILSVPRGRAETKTYFGRL